MSGNEPIFPLHRGLTLHHGAPLVRVEHREDHSGTRNESYVAISRSDAIGVYIEVGTVHHSGRAYLTKPEALAFLNAATDLARASKP